MKKRILCLILCLVLCMSTMSMLSGCGGASAPDALVIMSEALDGVFNPFFSTTGADNTIVSMTQMGMLTYGYENGEVVVAYGDEEAVVVKDYSIAYDEATDKTTYTFVLKNGILYSDGHPLTIEDVLFNLYVYLDPVYTGSSTMYSTDIVGLQDYRTQTLGADSSNADETIAEAAGSRAQNRINELINLYRQVGATSTAGSYSATYQQMVDAITTHSLSNGYKAAISNDPNAVSNANLLADYERALELFKEELYSDYESAQEAYTDEPYKSREEFKDPVTCFMYAEGYVTIEYEKDENNKDIKSKILKVTKQYNDGVVTDKDSAVNYVYESKIQQELDQILQYWATAQTLVTEYTAKAKEVILYENISDDGSLAVPNIAGIVSLGHSTDVATVTCNDGTYTVAHTHNDDGTVANDSEYDVLQITINGVDPKAIWNFAFSVAPQHYYAEGHDVDIVNNQFGVVFGSYDFMTNEVQSTRNIQVPMGAGPYVATNKDMGDNPDGTKFYDGNVVHFKANENFLLGKPNIEKVRYQVVSSTNAINALESGSVHFVSPQYTQNNIEQLDRLANKGIEKMWTDQLGYGYIGINAEYIPDINLRKAIMSAMNTSLALSYYSTGTAQTIYWPMSTVSWAYPTDASGNISRDNGHDYPSINFSSETAKEQIQNYMAAAGVSAGDPSLSLRFTIAGSSLTEHPCYQVFRAAAELLNELGWDVEVVADSNALTKLSTGSLAVWAAAWGSTIDPDLYQVYHKNSSATSTLAWGYDAILSNPSLYPIENGILNNLSDVIDAARATNDQEERTALYEEAMGYILDLAVELPVYQRSVLYAYNSKVIDSSSMPSELNPYTNPLDKIWELKFAE